MQATNSEEVSAAKLNLGKKRACKSFRIGLKSATATSLHLDDIQDASEGSSRRCCDSLARESFLWKASDKGHHKTGTDLKIQEHVSRLQEYSELCERVQGHHLETDDDPRRFHYQSRGLDNSSFLSASIDGGSFLSANKSPLLRPAGSASGRDLARRSSSSCPSHADALPKRPPPLGPAAVGGADGAAGHGRRPCASAGGSGDGGTESAVYRRQVVSALQAGRTVWL